MIERELKIGSTRFTKTIILDEPGQGNACHEYRIETVPQTESSPIAIVGQISFQNGPIKEFGVNGCHQEDLLFIVLDRLESFQAGIFKCRENAIAITKIQEAIHWLNHRTNDRSKRGVEGKNLI
jgi:hypothetical protein